MAVPPNGPRVSAVETRQLAELFQCPITKGKIRPMTASGAAQLKDRALRRELAHLDGSRVASFGWGLESADGQYAYLLHDDIFFFLPGDAIPLTEAARHVHVPLLSDETKRVQRFYEDFGWQKNRNGVFNDAALFATTQGVTGRYMGYCRQRLTKYLSSGRYLLDVASGPVHFPEYAAYSDRFEFRVCVDVSARALYEARARLGQKGLFVRGDILNLPLQSSRIDQSISLHTIYHLPQSRQVEAIREVFRVTKPGATVIIACISVIPILKILTPLYRLFAKRRDGTASEKRGYAPADVPWNDLYFYRFPWRKFRRELRPAECSWEMVVGGTFGHPLIQFFPQNAVGEAALRIVEWAEDKFPHIMARIGGYPLFILRKPC